MHMYIIYLYIYYIYMYINIVYIKYILKIYTYISLLSPFFYMADMIPVLEVTPMVPSIHGAAASSFGKCL